MDRVRTVLHVDELRRHNMTGEGVAAAVLDSGICLHPDYADRIVAFRDFVNGRSTCYDDASHGTHVSGILLGDGQSSRGRYCGIAPKASLIHLKVLDREGHGNIDAVSAAVEWVIKNRKNYQIRILNLSAGTTKGETDKNAMELVRLVEWAWDEGIVVVIAAGNMGPMPGSVMIPGTSRKVITVGAVNDRYAGGRHLVQRYSGCGPTGNCVCKPELVAPGTDVNSCSTKWRSGIFYSRKSGTSMAAPVVSGLIALLLEQEPELSNVEVKMRLYRSCMLLQETKSRQGWGMPDPRKMF